MYEHLYMKGSLRNTDEGFELKVRNLVNGGEATGIYALSIDGVGRSLAGVTIELEDKVHAADELSWQSSLFIPYGATLTVYVPGRLAPGDHKVTLAFDSPYGEVRIPFTDTVR
jgi:hypothetical protein